MGTGTIDLSYLGTVIGHLQPIMTRALPIIGTVIILNWILHIIKK